MRPQQRLFLAANYTFGRSIDEADSPFSLPADNYDLAAERGPALGYPRHRFMSMANVPLKKRFRLGTSLRAQSALPYNITTGRDDNGDTVSNDRPAGVTRNSRPRARAGGPRDCVSAGAWRSAVRRRRRRGRRSASCAATTRIRSAAWAASDGQNKRYTLELYAQSYNTLNRMNALNFSGVVSVAVLRPADVGGGAAAGRDRHAVLVLGARLV